MKQTHMTRKQILSTVMFLIVFSAVFIGPKAIATEPTFHTYHVERMLYPGEDKNMRIPGLAWVYVPENAVSQPTLVGADISFWRHTDDPQLMIHFSPAGITFNEPIVITLTLRAVYFLQGDTVQFLYYNESTEEWEVVNEFIVNSMTSSYSFTLDHFSLYAFSKIKNGDEE